MPKYQLSYYVIRWLKGLKGISITITSNQHSFIYPPPESTNQGTCTYKLQNKLMRHRHRRTLLFRKPVTSYNLGYFFCPNLK